MVYINKHGKPCSTVKKLVKTWFTVKIVYCEKAKLVDAQVPDAAYHNGPNP